VLEALRFLPGTSVSGRVRARSVLELSWSGTAEYRMMKLKRSSSVRVSMCFGCAMFVLVVRLLFWLCDGKAWVFFRRACLCSRPRFSQAPYLVCFICSSSSVHRVYVVVAHSVEDLLTCLFIKPFPTV